jgi:hypothetical protein
MKKKFGAKRTASVVAPDWCDGNLLHALGSWLTVAYCWSTWTA